jgi:virulence factor Mce-like protein
VNRRLLINFVAFGAVTALLVGYGLFTLLGNPFAKQRTISAVFPDATGLRPDFSVSMDGVVIGIVKDVELVDGGVRVEVALDQDVSVPSDVEGRIVRASPVGEQRVELTPTDGGSGKPLEDGDEFAVAESPNPPNISRVIDALARLIDAIPPEQLDTFIRETAIALEGRGEDLSTLVTSGDEFARSFVANEAAFRQLLQSAPPVMDSVSDAGPELQRALADTAILTEAIAARRTDLIELMRNGGQLGAAGGDVVTTQQANLGCLISDFADLNRFLGNGVPLENFIAGFDLNRKFFEPVDRLAPYGPAKDVGFGAPDRDDQYWLRVRFLVPPAQPPGEQYPQRRPTPATRPGGPCVNVLGTGVAAASQPDAVAPTDGGSIEPTADQPATPGPDFQNVAHATSAAPLSIIGVIVLVGAERISIAALRKGRRRGR